MFKTFPIILKCLLNFKFHHRLSYFLKISCNMLGLQFGSVTKSGTIFCLWPVKMLLLTHIYSTKLALSCFSGRSDGFMLLCPHILGECPFDHWHVFVRPSALGVEPVVMDQVQVNWATQGSQPMTLTPLPQCSNQLN